MNPELYCQTNELLRFCNSMVLEKYFSPEKWNCGEDVILDIGCGPGDLTTDVLIPFFPKSFRKLIGIDSAREMVDYAKNHYESAKMSFEHFNITTPNIPNHFLEKFNHVYSFNCLNWISNHKAVFRNIMKMLKPGGDMFLMYWIVNPVLDANKALAKNPIWQPHIRKIPANLEMQRYSKNPKEDAEVWMKEAGFQDRICMVEKGDYTFSDVSIAKDFYTSIDYFCSRLPENLRNDYMTDFIRELRRFGPPECNKNQLALALYYNLMVVGRKPINEK